MIDVYTWPTPNGHKVHIMLEECGLEHNIHGINIRKGDQFSDDFLKISPNNRIPAIVDQVGPGGAPYSLFESGAILIYLAEKTGKFLRAEGRARHDTLQWLMFQMGNVGPMFGQAHHFRNYAAEKMEYSIERYTNESGRLYRIMDKHLGENEYLAGDEYTIADIANWCWVRTYKWSGVSSDGLPNLKRWRDALRERPACKRGVEVPRPLANMENDREAADAFSKNARTILQT